MYFSSNNTNMIKSRGR